MTKSNRNHIEKWSKVIDNVFEERDKINNKLSPSKLQINSIVDFSRNINDKAQLIRNVSDMAHEKIVDFELAQKIIDNQIKNVEKDIKYLKSYLGVNINE
ncbi:hypothetical protein [Paraliobacillus ryukyuensis]|uniref:hypothetical protein n=1 Tax=Paraliobacillus ryukyuensis TaxID=200904 RepID=UPI0009A68644|nr:hypothetical protein [Paraliobacillus ryukyuensis]